MSPYAAPASTFHETITPRAMRWRAAYYFAFVPALFMVLMEAEVIYSASRSEPMYWHLKLLEPLLFCAPLCLLMAATGYAVALKCLNKTIGRTVLVGCAVGAGWALFVIIAGNAIAQWNGATPLTLDRVIKMLTIIPAIFVPLAVVLCIFTRWQGDRLGAAGAPGQPDAS